MNSKFQCLMLSLSLTAVVACEQRSSKPDHAVQGIEVTAPAEIEATASSFAPLVINAFSTNANITAGSGINLSTDLLPVETQSFDSCFSPKQLLQEDVPNRVRYGFIRRLTAIPQSDLKTAQLVTTEIFAVVAKTKHFRPDFELIDRALGLNAAEFKALCGDRFVASRYSGATIYFKTTALIRPGKALPTTFSYLIDDLDENKIAEMDKLYQQTLIDDKTELEQDYSMGIQSPALLWSSPPSNLSLVQKMQMFVQLAVKSKTKMPSPIPMFEVAPYTEILK